MSVDLHEIRGRVSGVGGVKAQVGTVGQVGGTVTLPSIAQQDPYDGPYTVTPRISEQTLATAHKSMSDDVVVNGIPVTYTSNVYDGRTVVIG